MLVIAPDLEIRGKEKKTSQKGKDYVIVRVDDVTGKLIELLDWNTDNYDKYNRGDKADFTLKLDIGKYINISIADFTIKAE